MPACCARRRAAARGGLPGMHWDFSYPAGWLAEVLPDIVCLWVRLCVAAGLPAAGGCDAMRRLRWGGALLRRLRWI
jgi:hypothetical protein